MHNFRGLNIWKDSMDLARQILQLTKKFPSIERFSLVSQMNRCAISIPSNIAEGSARKSNKEFMQFLRISLGSAFELETQIILSFESGYLNEEVYAKLISRIQTNQKMISGFIKTLE
jgi:four helix bundle protein